MLASFGGTGAALIAFALWSNRKFSFMAIQIAKIEGKLGINI